jgi:hypothetical protein
VAVPGASVSMAFEQTAELDDERAPLLAGKIAALSRMAACRIDVHLDRSRASWQAASEGVAAARPQRELVPLGAVKVGVPTSC